MMPKPDCNEPLISLRTKTSQVLSVSVSLCLCITLLSCEPMKRVVTRNQTGSLDYLKGEFEQIRTLPGSIAGHQQSMDKGRQGHVGTAYTTTQTYDAIKAHYDAELTKRGWSFSKTEKVIYSGHDYGGQHVFFCKGIYTADLQFAGEQEKDFGWTYSFSLSWGLYDECS